MGHTQLPPLSLRKLESPQISLKRFQDTECDPEYSLLIVQGTSYQLPVTSYQLPVTSYQLSVTSYQLPVTSY